MRLDRLDHQARRQHGLITRAQFAGEFELSRSAWRRALAGGSLIEVHCGVARCVGTSDTPEQRIAAAVLAAGGAALASHRSAARLWGLDRPDDDPVDLIIPGRSRQPRTVGVHVHRPRDHRSLRPQRRSGIACTNIVRTLCDLAAVDPADIGTAVGQALAAKLIDLDGLDAALLTHAERGRSGIVALRRAVEDWAVDRRPADSVLELAFLRLARRHALPSVSFHEVLAGWEVDFRFVGTAIVVECDGWSSHGLDREQFERDRRRDADLRAAGWIPIRVSYRAIVHDSGATALRLRRNLERWSHIAAPDRDAA